MSQDKVLRSEEEYRSDNIVPNTQSIINSYKLIQNRGKTNKCDYKGWTIFPPVLDILILYDNITPKILKYLVVQQYHMYNSIAR